MKRKHFQKIYIEITNRCNLQCSFCPADTRPSKLLSPAEFEIIASQVSLWTDHICLHVKGEPLMHPQLSDILDIAAGHRLMVNLTTNATLLPQKGPLLLTETAPRQVSLSLHSFEANIMHNQDFDTYLAEAIHFAKAFTARTPGYISFRLWNLIPESIGQITAAGRCSCSRQSGTADQRVRNQHILETLEAAYHLLEPIESRLHKYHGNSLAERTFLNFDQLFDWPDTNAPDYGPEGTCYGLRRQLAILSDGRVVPCCLDSEGRITLGNIFEETLSDILKKERSHRIVEGFCKHKIEEPLCRHCGYRSRF